MIKFSSAKKAIQYLADYTGKRVVVAAVATREEVKKFQSNLSKELGLKSLRMYVSGSDLILDSIIVERISQRQGVGTKAMEEIIDFADQHSMKIVLTTGEKDLYHGTTSGSRLIKFYKRFGFVENKGRNKDFAISGNMYRDPK